MAVCTTCLASTRHSRPWTVPKHTTQRTVQSTTWITTRNTSTLVCGKSTPFDFRRKEYAPILTNANISVKAGLPFNVCVHSSSESILQKSVTLNQMGTFSSRAKILLKRVNCDKTRFAQYYRTITSTVATRKRVSFLILIRNYLVLSAS